MKLMRRWLLQLSVPIQKLMQKMHPPERMISYKFVKTFTYVDWDANLQDGDVLLSREKWHFTNIFIPGFWSHAAVFASGGVFEAVGEGVGEVDLFEWLYKKDYVMILRPTFLGDRARVAMFVLKQKGKPYDFKFSSGIKAWYCSELVYKALSAGAFRRAGSDVFTLRKTFGVSTVTPQDFENAAAKGKFTIIADSRKT